ncbi:SCP2 sterol-binding domain-containing protein [Haloglomus halophilum]|jgi:putative sterol carrier protein|uniref:SCP2 sterol-binding domain-containing protein n=1 Tax=Haloglomus halophilum TaxID=2962672 RepID=UPI0020C974F6|nr:SCP2 sterol-binding domain-containing protein [Haloglomus halophilum]
MTDPAFDDLDAVVSANDDQFKRDLPDEIAGLDDEAAVGELLLEHPDTYEDLSRKMSTLDGVADYASDETETVERFLTVLWAGQELVTEHVPEVREQITDSFTVTWECEDSPVSFHMETDAESGRITGGLGPHGDAELVFRGPTDVLFSMLNDPDFQGVQAFLEGKFEIEGPIQKAQQLDATMQVATDHMRDLDPESAAL